MVHSMAAIAALLGVMACGGGGGGTAGGGSGDDGSYPAGPGPLGGATLYSDFRVGKKLVLHQRGAIAVTPAAMRDRLATMEVALDAFDGVFLHLPNTTDSLMKPTSLGSSTIAADLEPLYALRPTKLRHNFAVVTVQRDLDAFDDWTTVLGNFSRLARVARDAGLVGIVVDNESIAGLRANHPYDVTEQAKTLPEYHEQTRLVSRRIMEAIVAEFPDAVVVVLRGAAGAEPKSPSHLVNCESRDPAGVYVDAPCGPTSAALLGSFFAGFVEGKGARSLVVDGGTDYGLRTAEQFAGSATWRKVTLASAATAAEFVPDALRTAWPAAVNASFGVRELDGAHGNLLPNDTALFAGTIRAALNAADSFAWASFDLTDLTRVAANNAWATAARRGKAAAASPSVRLVSEAAATGTGLMAQYYGQIDESELSQTLVDPYIDNVWSGTGPSHTLLAGQNDNFSVIWTGFIEAPVTGTYTIYGTTDDGMRIHINGVAVIDAWFFQGPTEYAGTIDLVAGQRYPIKIRYFEGGGLTEAHVGWLPPGGVKEVIPTERLYPMH
jgi:hypothetical protein